MTRTEFEQALTPEHVKTLQAVQFGLVMGPLLFAVVIGVIAIQPRPPVEGGEALVRILSLAHLIVFLTCLGAGRFLPEQVFSPQRLASAPAAEWVKAQQTALILRLGLIEAPSLLGLVACLVAVFDGVLPAKPVYFANLVSLVVLVVVGIRTFPTKERLVAWFERRIGTA